MDHKKLITYIKGELHSEKEISEVLDWIEQSEANQRHYNRLKNLWVITGLHALSGNQVKTRTLPGTSGRAVGLFRMELLKYAAIFVMAFLLGGAVIYQVDWQKIRHNKLEYNEIVVPKGEKTKVTLYDGTQVWLNSQTTLRYPVVFDKKERKVFLEGEAYFDVSKQNSQNFIVQAGNLDVEVFGTKFNVAAYSGDDHFYVTLEEGKVTTSNRDGTEQLVLTPGHQAIYSHQTNRFEAREVDTELYSSWKENLLRFEDASFEEIIKKIEHWYGVDITVGESVDLSKHYTMTIKTESLRELLELLTKTSNINYEINEDQVLIKRP